MADVVVVEIMPFRRRMEEIKVSGQKKLEWKKNSLELEEQAKLWESMKKEQEVRVIEIMWKKRKELWL